MANQLAERIIAFAGIHCALAQVQYVARHESFDQQAVSDCLASIMITNPDKTTDVYPSPQLLQSGYQLIAKQLGDSSDKDIEITRYLVGILSLERKLIKSGKMAELGERINQVNRQLMHFKITDEQVISNFAQIYTDIISPLGPKIMVGGKPELLKRDVNLSRIRALLLSAIRSAVLWRQLGGKRRDLVFSRSAILNAAKQNITPTF
ncbi:MAG: high frequency lysogenization protein HflD [Parashewanella sp.]